MEYSKLSDRKKRILNAVVESYIDSAEPISSQVVKDNFLQDISSATIRSELATLEEMGYLIQPHTSSGRVPSSDAYRVYVETMIGNVDELTPEEIAIIAKYFDKKYEKVDDIIHRIGKVISDITNYTSIILLDDVSNVTLKSINLIDTGETLLIVIVTDAGVISDQSVAIKGMAQDEIETCNKLLNSVFKGKKLKELNCSDEIIINTMQQFRVVIDEIVRILSTYRSKYDDKVYLDGTNNILNHKEYTQDLDETRNLLSTINEKDKLIQLLDSENSNIEFNIKIGSDEVEGMKHSAIVTTKLSINGNTEVKAGVIGPERMNYNKVRSVLDYVSKLLSKIGE